MSIIGSIEKTGRIRYCKSVVYCSSGYGTLQRERTGRVGECSQHHIHFPYAVVPICQRIYLHRVQEGGKLWTVPAEEAKDTDDSLCSHIDYHHSYQTFDAVGVVCEEPRLGHLFHENILLPRGRLPSMVYLGTMVDVLLSAAIQN